MSSENMFVYDLSLDTKGKKPRLPPLQSWLNPKFHGIGNLIYNPDANDPKNFKKDFPEYVYQYDELIKMKNELNKAKSPLDQINTTPERTSRFSKITNCFRSYDALRGRNGILAREYGAEIVTNAWLKMFENMIFLDPLLTKINKGKSKVFNSIHLAEAPGNFILAMNHYLRLYPKVEWDWLANSYRDLYSHTRHENTHENDQQTHYLDDVYGLIRHYPNKWIFGADGDGDITSVPNIISFKQDAICKLKGDVHFVTSDVKYAPSDMNYDEEENYNIPVHLGHLLCALTLLSSGGIMMLKEFTFFEASSVSLLYLLANCFDRLLIVKPRTSKAANAEVYIFGIGYRDNLTEMQIDALQNIMSYIRFLNNAGGSPAIFKKEDIPKSFVEKIVDFSKKLISMQIPSIQRNIELFYKYQDLPYNKLCQDFTNKETMARDWIKKTEITPLDPKNKIGIYREFHQNREGYRGRGNNKLQIKEEKKEVISEE